jgi:hypothetical protein
MPTARLQQGVEGAIAAEAVSRIDDDDRERIRVGNHGLEHSPIDQPHACH